MSVIQIKLEIYVFLCIPYLKNAEMLEEKNILVACAFQQVIPKMWWLSYSSYYENSERWTDSEKKTKIAMDTHKERVSEREREREKDREKERERERERDYLSYFIRVRKHILFKR